MKYDATTFGRYKIRLGLSYAGVPLNNQPYIISDFAEDSFWNDPKEIRKRILAEGGDPGRYFDYMKRHFDVEFVT